MRLWSLHPRHLDAKGIVALWRESLLAQKVLRGKTVAYRHHPQLVRFRETSRPVAAIVAYLREVREEALRRGYNFDASKLARGKPVEQIPVSSGQLDFEIDHLSRKLWKRDRSRHRELKATAEPEPHPLFAPRAGPVED